jgi:hypothetical protein
MWEMMEEPLIICCILYGEGDSFLAPTTYSRLHWRSMVNVVGEIIH